MLINCAQIGQHGKIGKTGKFGENGVDGNDGILISYDDGMDNLQIFIAKLGSFVHDHTLNLGSVIPCDPRNDDIEVLYININGSVSSTSKLDRISVGVTIKNDMSTILSNVMANISCDGGNAPSNL